jgi:phage shock protein C
MNIVHNINLGGYPFVINEDAFQYLENYLDAIHHHFRSVEGGEEIITDIENRLAELLIEIMAARKIVSRDDIERAITIMGKPEEFDEDNEGASPGDQSNRSHEEEPFKFKAGKRLYKNPDDKIVSGVASGIAAYLGIKDPVIVRILFVLLTIFGGGVGIPIYIVLIFVLKEAKTPKEKLEMRGEAINLESLSQVVQKEMKQFSEQIKDITGTPGFKGKKEKFASWTNQFNEKAKKYSNPSSYKAKEASSASFESDTNSTSEEKGSPQQEWDPTDLVEQAKEASRRFGQSFELAIRGFVKVVTPIFLALGGILIGVFVIAWAAIIFSLIKGAPVIMMFMPTSSVIAGVGFINIVFIVVIPIIAIILGLLRIFFRRNISGPIWGSIISLWIINIFSLSVVGTQIADSFKTPFTVIENLISNPEKVTSLHLKAMRTPSEGHIQIGPMSFNDEYLYASPTIISVEKSNDQYFHLIEQKSAKGKNESEAKTIASAITQAVSVKQDTLIIAEDLKVPIDGKFRAQRVELILQIPVNQHISLDKELGNLRFRSTLPGDPLYNRDLRGNKLYLLQEGLKIVADSAKVIQ